MPSVFKYPLALLFTLLSIPLLQATHNRAGEISVEQEGDCTTSLTVKATIVTYTKASSRPADRDTLTICWGDGICERVARVNGIGSPPQGEPLENDTKKNIYCGFHTYTARGTYVISMTDPNRNGGIINVNPPNSDQVKFHIQTTYTIPNPQFQGCNDTPILLQPPIDIGCVGQVFTHNPNAYDADGDSLSYHLIQPLQDVGLVVPNYEWPYAIGPGPDNTLTIDEVTGDIVWDAPQQQGEYNLAMIIVEYRQGIPIDTIVRDMQILIKECENLPPVVEVPFEEICVVAGDLLEFNVIGTAPLEESTQKVRLTALGGPFEVLISPATFTPETNEFEDDPVTKVFRWQTTCDHISGQYYSVVFKAVDNFFGDTSGLATLKTVRIKVVGPPPEDLEAAPSSNQITVSWANPYTCEDTNDEYFRGFTIWRRLGSNNFSIDTCTPGLAGRGYIRLTPIPILDINQDGRYFYQDQGVERGKTYCYRVLAIFAKTTPDGNNAYNRVESLPSEEVCVQLNRDVPLITKADVLTTSGNNGQVGVCWSKPKAEDLDTIMNAGPYTYELLRATGQTDNDADFQPIGVSFTSPTFAGANDTCYIDINLNTIDNAYSYRVNFYVNGENAPLGTTNTASTVYLSASPTDNANILSWTEIVPWNNESYTVYRQNALGNFDSIATVTTNTYTDVELFNGTSYCYKVRSTGSYGIVDVINPIINFSQELCSTPFDNVAPCPPTLTVDNVCESGVNCSEVDVLANTLNWVNPMDICDETDDVVGYNIYYTPIRDQEFSLIASFDDSGVLEFSHEPQLFGIAGCYYVTAIDTFFNESLGSDTICVDNCPFYELPNTFTPNGDTQNDLFRPFPYCFVETVDFQVYNRWGELVFKTEDPNLNWDGTNLKGEQLVQGVYYYTCRIFEQRVDGVAPNLNILSGYIELIRGK
ncbi:MAG: hypothetical protein DHS20C18_28170 [Saprospiraceae bacterium]|nr:MAG: hypothetical protein DHS20C18_28170 [Saprospiraceae bacterium]